MATAIDRWLKEAEGRWGEAKEKAKKGGDFERHPDGRYVARITGAEAGESQTSERPQIKWTYTIIEGELRGESFYDYDGLDNENSLYYLARKLARFGFDPDKIRLRKLQSYLDELTERKPVVVIRARTKGEYQNILIDRVLEDYEEETEDDDEDLDEEDEDLEEEEELAVGMLVEFDKAGKTRQGKITKLDEANEQVLVKVGTKLIRVDAADCVLVEDDEDEDED